MTETLETGERLGAINATLFQRGEKASYSLCSSFAFYGKNNTLTSNLLHHTLQTHTHALRNCSVIFRLFGVKLLFHSKDNVFVTGSMNHLLTANL